MLSCLLLAAGQSQRFGSPKALVKFKDQLIIQRLQQTILDAKIDELIIVLGAHAQEIEPFLLKHSQVQFVYNKDYNFGQTSSFIKGLEKINKLSQGIVLLPVDYPWVASDTITALREEFYRHSRKIIIPVHNGKKGHPPIFPIRLKDQFLKLDYSQGINSVFRDAGNEINLFPVDDPGVIQTFNTRAEFEKITAEFK
ncbi:MAG: NTP transferase domain-containing protein [Candidatus Omnitrophota bacterium]